MSNFISQEMAVVATIDPQLLDDGTAQSDWVDMSKFEKAIFVISVGATDTTFDAKIQGAVDSTGGTPVDISSKAITQLDAANKQAIIEVDRAELSSVQTHCSCHVTAGDGTNGVQCSVIGLGCNARYNPASDDDLASVAEIVA